MQIPQKRQAMPPIRIRRKEDGSTDAGGAPLVIDPVCSVVWFELVTASARAVIVRLSLAQIVRASGGRSANVSDREAGAVPAATPTSHALAVLAEAAVAGIPTG